MSLQDRIMNALNVVPQPGAMDWKSISVDHKIVIVSEAINLCDLPGNVRKGRVGEQVVVMTKHEVIDATKIRQAVKYKCIVFEDGTLIYFQEVR